MSVSSSSTATSRRWAERYDWLTHAKLGFLLLPGFWLLVLWICLMAVAFSATLSWAHRENANSISISGKDDSQKKPEVFAAEESARIAEISMRMCVAISIFPFFLFFLFFGLWIWSRPQPIPPPPAALTTAPGAYPAYGTKMVAGLLLLIAAVSVAGLLLCINPPTWPAPLGFMNASNRDIQDAINAALITMFAAGIGSCIATIRAFIWHACREGDFKYSYIPWYVARPVMGMLLGLLFFFIMKGGLVATVGADMAKGAELNMWTFAAIGGLVGLFSRRAIEKLREIFRTMFRTEEEMKTQLAEESGSAEDAESSSDAHPSSSSSTAQASSSSAAASTSSSSSNARD